MRMEERCSLSSSVGLALVFVGSFFVFDSYHLNLFTLNSSFFPTNSNSSSSFANSYNSSSNGNSNSSSSYGNSNSSSSDGNSNSSYSDGVAMLARIHDAEKLPQFNITDHDPTPTSAFNGNSSSVGEITKNFISRRKTVGKVEMELREARAAIRNAARFHNTSTPLQSVLRGGVYRNVHAFQQSYAEMDKRFKMFVYPEGEPPLVHNGPCKNIYTAEGRFIHELEMGNPFRTWNPEEAHVYFLPFSVVMMISFIYKPKSYDLAPVRRFVSDYIHVVADKYPFWNRSLGADHFMLSCHDWGPHTSMAHEYLYNNSIRVLCNANTSEGFNPAKDATLPEVNLKTGLTKGLLGGLSALRRPLLAFFAGGNHGPIRPLLFKHWKTKDDDIQVFEYLPKDLSYSEMMKKSKYCLCPSGYEVASPRIVEAIYSECVPVIISDHYVLPFSDVLNWKAFSLQLPSSEIPNLKQILQSISVNRYVQMQRRVKQAQKHFVVNQPPKPLDLFHMILHSIWLRRLNVEINQ